MFQQSVGIFLGLRWQDRHGIRSTRDGWRVAAQSKLDPLMGFRKKSGEGVDISYTPMYIYIYT